MDPSLEYACKRIQELESLLLVDVPETVWPAEVGMVFSQIEVAGELPAIVFYSGSVRASSKVPPFFGIT